MAETGNIQINKYLPFALVYFFLNSLFMPEGLLYTTLLTPLFLYHVIISKKLNHLIIFVALTLLFYIIHFFLGVNNWSYFKSWCILLTVFIFCLWFYDFCNRVNNPEYIFKCILYINALLIPFALLSLKYGFLKNYFWYEVPISPGIPIIPRLKMFTYEASYYSMLLIPLVFYFIWQYFTIGKKINTLNLILVLIPIALSFSLGVITGIALTMAIVILQNIYQLSKNRRIVIISILSGLILVTGFIILYKFFPDNPLIARLKNIPTGKDTSARGRTYEALELGYLIAEQKSIWFGAGLGQIKEIGRNIIIQYYHFTSVSSGAMRIPNAVAETLAMYGYVGIILRFSIILFLFIKTKVYTNYYRLSLFIFIFIYQFTGSYIFNIVEYVIWILSFSSLFPQFNKNKVILNE